MELRMSEVAAATAGRLEGHDRTVRGASIDSRNISPGQLFVPVVAERDGHDFIPAAVHASAAGYLTSRPTAPAASPAAAATPLQTPAVTVDDTSAALTALGRYARDRLGTHVAVVGVTGSVGKTSVKDLLRAVLVADRPTHASERSFNNELGVPLTLLNAPPGTEAAVVEMGARGVGHIEDLCDVAQPTVGVVTRVAAVHTELFGGLDHVAQAKGELVEALPADGVAVLNQTDPRVAAMAARTDARVVTYGDNGHVHASDISLDEELRPSFTLESPWGRTRVTLRHARGVHMVENALGAAAAALAVDVPLATVATALADAPLSPWRMELHRTAAGGVVLNDAYNANPTSVAAALRSLAALPARRRVAVLGTMAELGADADEAHRAISLLASELGIDMISVAEPALGGRVAVDVDEAADALDIVDEGVAVLVKGSRVAGLERLADRLR